MFNLHVYHVYMHFNEGVRKDDCDHVDPVVLLHEFSEVIW